LHNLPDEHFDVITLWHVLEHVDELMALMNTLFEKLKAGGIIVLAQPNPESWDAKHYGKYWAAWDVPIHYYHFKRKNISKLAAKVNLTLCEVINMPFDAFYISLLSEEYKEGRKNWINAIINGLKSNLDARKSKNASSLTYILKKSQA
jgi:predicted SAM-dependent methyltransferase